MYGDDYYITEVEQRGRKEMGRRRGQMEREKGGGEGGGENWMLGWSWLMVSTEERGIKKVEKDKKDKNRWRGKKRRMHGWSMRKERDGKEKEWWWRESVFSYRQRPEKQNINSSCGGKEKAGD